MKKIVVKSIYKSNDIKKRDESLIKILQKLMVKEYE
jgi:hypothetical protein